MDLSIIYASRTGHSRKIALELASRFHTNALDVKQNPKVERADLLVAVGGIYAGKYDSRLLHFASSLSGNIKNAVTITSSASGDPRDALASLLTSKGVNVMDNLTCRGSFLYFMARSHPDTDDLNRLTDELQEIINSLQ